MIEKIKIFLSYSNEKKASLLKVRIAKAFFSYFDAFFAFRSISLAHLPDSMTIFSQHNEIFRLYGNFSRFNSGNNGGDIQRLISLVLNIKQCVEVDGVEGDFAEVGVWRGNTASVLAYFATLYDRECMLFDTFEGFSEQDIEGVDASAQAGGFASTSIDMVKSVIGKDGINSCHFVKGYFPESITREVEKKRFSVVSLDCDLYKPMQSGLEWFFERMDDGALFLLHDYSSGCWEGSKQAVDEFCIAYKQRAILMPDKSGSAFIKVRK